ncbi:histone PARylation factor 1 [Bombyx mori]|uniref:PBZ-type domain-containing protein n=1 Tax=Bombyx mori TaxID=7091 RepID=A0A8R2DKZ4_BOMMO|nr:histone PARylation factor 1 isoform X1 [Bombyx mori]XP_021204811.1 histone PARylation factor 1 isoform X1 [Bombyx mori]
MSEACNSNAEDSRTVCKYGEKCYQKNPEHHKKYKHPGQAGAFEKKNEKNPGKLREKRFNPYSSDDKPAKQHKVGDKKPDIELENGSGTSESSTVVKIDTVNPIHALKLPKNITYYDSSDHSVLKELFLVKMPSDFYKFFDCLNTDDAIVKICSSVNLELIGPFELLLGKLPQLDDKELYLVHWRFFYDPPEFQAVLKIKGKSEYHIGYFRDDPNDEPVFLASNDSAKDCQIKPLADNIFGAVYLHLKNENKSPFTALACKKLMETIKKYADEHNFSLNPYDMKKRKSTILTNSFHRAGIVVPYNKKTQLGYRPLVENDVNLKKLFDKLQAAKTQSEKDNLLSDLQPIITYASIAMDECDFGTGVEMGINLFCSGLKELESNVLGCICPAYNLLNRGEFSKIIQAHMKYRRKGPNVSLLNLFEH